MILRLKIVFLGLSITASTMISALDNPLKPIIEIVKAPGIAQKQLGYSNDISDLINNGNTWALVTALGLKYGYNHFGNRAFRNLGVAGTADAVLDFSQYSTIAKKRDESLTHQSQKESSKTKKFEMGRDGLIQVIGSMIAYKFLGLAVGPFRFFALVCIAYVGLTGGKKMYDAYFYQEYLTNEIENNNYIKTILSRAREQLKNNAVQNVAHDAKQVFQDASQQIQDTAQNWTEKAQNKIKQLKGK